MDLCSLTVYAKFMLLETAVLYLKDPTKHSMPFEQSIKTPISNVHMKDDSTCFKNITVLIGNKQSWKENIENAYLKKKGLRLDYFSCEKKITSVVILPLIINMSGIFSLKYIYALSRQKHPI